ncbi:DUF4245 domain-containing protein [Leekyejoonella antrihumi]|uniref:DUF4245 domain-containing protein n=1 Tax=Leekyejoonella antrihumi TaxID=1660198 RepID=A0A563E6G0_9MICO|nr:DUF4245 domain-containing protein [Leekyejoonella antrihumi]TWP37424.1 DUF4245 domain-containing protein [Leekyejoonella antrihumi]
MSDQSSAMPSSTPHRPADAPGQAVDGAAAPTEAEQAPTPPTRRGMSGTVKSMIISMIVVLGACLIWIAMVPRVSSVSTPVTDLPGLVRETVRSQHWDVAVADGLPSGWEPTNVLLLTPAGRPVTWQAGYQGPNNAYAAVLQTRNGDAAWRSDQTSNGSRAGTVTIAGVTWTKYQQSSNSQLSLVRSTPVGGLSTVVTGTTDWAQLKMFAAALVPFSQSTEARLPTATVAP